MISTMKDIKKQLGWRLGVLLKVGKSGGASKEMMEIEN